jgi:hypothetical protein
VCAETVDPDVFRQRLADQIAGIRALASAVDTVLNVLREPSAESVAMSEIAAEQNYRSRSEWRDPIADTHAFALATLRASCDYVRGFAALFDANEPPLYAHLPLARAALEAAGTSLWLSELGVGVLDRMKRGLCELLYSANEVDALELSDDAGESVRLWEGVAQSFGWDLNNSRSKPVIAGARRPRISESIVQLADSRPGSQAGNILFSRLSAADHVTWFGLSWAMDMASVAHRPTSTLGTVPVGTDSRQFALVAFYIVRGLRVSANNLFTFMGWTDAAWEQAVTATQELELQFAQAASRLAGS